MNATLTSFPDLLVLRRRKAAQDLRPALADPDDDPLARAWRDAGEGGDVHLMRHHHQHAGPLPVREDLPRRRQSPAGSSRAVAEEGVEGGLLHHLAGKGQFRRFPRPAPLGGEHPAHRDAPRAERLANGARLRPALLIEVPLRGAIAQHETGGIARAWRIGMAEEDDGARLPSAAARRSPSARAAAKGRTEGQQQERAADDHAA